MQVNLTAFQASVQSLLNTSSMPTTCEQRYQQLALVDPYPGVPAALLHAGHLATYVIVAGIIDPFEIDDLTKPATYLVPLEGLVRYVNAQGNEERFVLSKSPHALEADVRNHVVLEPNAICYITLKPTFRLPAYIAARFNLLIRDVYRGLLVGTGPLVDPGFEGQLSIPVHNFTSNSYRLEAGEGFVYFEFTKLSWRNPDRTIPIPAWVPQPIEDQPPFPSSKKVRRNLDNYLAAATIDGATPRNAISAQVTALTALNENVRRRNSLIGIAAIVGAISLLISTYAAVATAFQIYLGAQQFTKSASGEVAASIAALSAHLGEVDRLTVLNQASSDALRNDLKSLREIVAQGLDGKAAATTPSPPYEPLTSPNLRR